MKCASCGAEHPRLDPVFRRPDDIAALSPEERPARASESEDVCWLKTDDDKRWFIRCVLPIRLDDARGETVTWGVWAEVTELPARRIQSLWDSSARDKERPFEAMLANRIPGVEPSTVGLPVSLQLTGLKTRPLLSFLSDDHPFAREWRDGVTTHRAAEWLDFMSGRKGEHLKGIVCLHVIEDDLPILLVARDVDGDWQFLCGEEVEHDDAELVGIRHLHERDPTLREVMDLEPGEEAERAGVGSEWLRGPYSST